jgi:hypothetical protein
MVNPIYIDCAINDLYKLGLAGAGGQARPKVPR